MKRLLLFSNSTEHGRGYLDHGLDAVRELLGATSRILFVPFALADRAAYTEKFRGRLGEAGFEVDELAADARGQRQVESAEAVFVGGGNTFRLLKTVQDAGLLTALGARARDGMPYLGASAGINLACPTIRTTNDMPIVEPRGFDALGLVPFQINPHYVDPEIGSVQMFETRELRIGEFLEENERAVVGLREGSWIRVDGERARLGGRLPARVFRRGVEPEEREPGSALDDLMAG
jgi:dipeptidase E